VSTALPSDTLRCVSCGASACAALPNGLCARCLLGAGLDFDAAFTDESAGLDSDAPRQVGRYRILTEIAHGGVGIVYHAWQADLCRDVALKMLLPSRIDTNDARDRFRREAEVMARLDHPGILPVYEVGVEGNRPYFSMKLAEGGNLAERAAMLRGRFREIARLVAGIARAIAHAHARGVLHRDLKPSNIVFDADGQPLVTDFGLARFLERDSSLTGIDTLIGTPRYVAPEVVIGAAARLTAVADVYGLGAILYELLTGSAPFAELTSLEVLREIATRRVRTPRQIDGTIPPALEAICLRCLEKRPDDRYASANALADALDAWLAGSKASLLARLGWLNLDLPSRRRRGAMLAAAACAVALAVFAYAYATREPIPIPDPATAAHTVVVLPDLLKGNPAEDISARRIAERLQLPEPFHVLPYEATVAIARPHRAESDTDLDASVGAFIVVPLSLQNDGALAVMVLDDFRQERLFGTTYAPGEEDRVAKEIAAAIVEKRTQPTAEAHLSRPSLAKLLRGIRLVLYPDEGTNATAIAAFRDVIEASPDSAVAHAWLANAYNDHGGEAFWIDSSIDEAARAQRMDPTLGFAAARLGYAYQSKGWFVRATTAYEQAQSQGTMFLEQPLALIYYQRGRFRDAYHQVAESVRFGTDIALPQVLAAQILLAAGETDAGERALRRAMALEPSASQRALHEAEIAWYRNDFSRCRTLAAELEPERDDGFFSASSLIRSCAIEQGDFAAALATMTATEQAYERDHSGSNSNHPALRKAILLAEVGRGNEIGALVKTARQGLQATIDGSSDFPPVWLRMAAAQHLDGEIDAAYATLERAFALGLTVNRRNRNDPEFLPFRGEPRFEAMRAKSEAYVGEQRKLLQDALKSGEPNLVFSPDRPSL